MEVNGFIIEPQSGEAGANEISISVPSINEGIDKIVEVDAVCGDQNDRLTLVHEGLRQRFITSDGQVLCLADGGRFAVLKSKKSIPYLEFEALEDGLTFSMTNSTIQYSLDGTSWTSLPANTTSEAVNVGEKVYLKATGLTPNSSSGIGRFIINKKCNLGGTPMSLLFGDEVDKYSDLTGYNYALRQLFYSCSKVIRVSDDFLPATKLSSGCYYGMFMECSSLTNAPKLAATKLGGTSYYYMFQNCTSLEYPPELPATTVGASEYRSMFQGCTALKVAPTLPATTLGSACYYDMFNGCKSLETTPLMPSLNLTADCYGRMFMGCVSLKTAYLPAIKLAARCYSSIFNGCSSLSYIEAMFITEPSTSYTSSWVNGVSSTGSFVKNKEATWEVFGIDGIPNGWEVKYK